MMPLYASPSGRDSTANALGRIEPPFAGGFHAAGQAGVQEALSAYTMIAPLRAHPLQTDEH
jgi:hypothetical protein